MGIRLKTEYDFLTLSVHNLHFVELRLNAFHELICMDVFFYDEFQWNILKKLRGAVYEGEIYDE